jgi:hypothetical protein
MVNMVNMLKHRLTTVVGRCQRETKQGPGQEPDNGAKTWGDDPRLGHLVFVSV